MTTSSQILDLYALFILGASLSRLGVILGYIGVQFWVILRSVLDSLVGHLEITLGLLLGHFC